MKQRMNQVYQRRRGHRNCGNLYGICAVSVWILCRGEWYKLLILFGVAPSRTVFAWILKKTERREKMRRGVQRRQSGCARRRLGGRCGCAGGSGCSCSNRNPFYEDCAPKGINARQPKMGLKCFGWSAGGNVRLTSPLLRLGEPTGNLSYAFASISSSTSTVKPSFCQNSLTRSTVAGAVTGEMRSRIAEPGFRFASAEGWATRAMHLSGR